MMKAFFNYIQAMHTEGKLAFLLNHYQKHRSVSIDSRKVQHGTLFFALSGDRTDGNRFAKGALENGASYAVVDKPELAGEDDRLIVVDDSLKCLQDLATLYILSLSAVRIGITGSNGKTTTKELMQRILSRKYKVHANAGNYNNHIGLPLTVLSCPQDVEVLVLEMGANKRGDIRELAEIGRPTHGVVTCIGLAHLEGMGGLEGVKKTKGELYDYLAQSGGTAFVNRKLDFLEELSRGVGSRVFYGRECEDDGCTLSGLVEKGALYAEGTVRFKAGEFLRVRSNLFGQVHFDNILTALAVGYHFGVGVEEMGEEVAAYRPSGNRVEWVELGLHKLLMDAYNANPDSTVEAVRSFGMLEGDDKVLVLGEMLELGPYSEEGHRAVLEEVGRHSWKAVLTLGAGYYELGDFPGRGKVEAYMDFEQLKAAFVEALQQPSTVLVKGSRGNTLERLKDCVPGSK
jgi:UDP-N-acetylmuramoyl-tripeptide--D-alanyl-D-alanine ligase